MAKLRNQMMMWLKRHGYRGMSKMNFQQVKEMYDAGLAKAEKDTFVTPWYIRDEAWLRRLDASSGLKKRKMDEEEILPQIEKKLRMTDLEVGNYLREIEAEELIRLRINKSQDQKQKL